MRAVSDAGVYINDTIGNGSSLGDNCWQTAVCGGVNLSGVCWTPPRNGGLSSGTSQDNLLGFWMEGVLSAMVGIGGVIGN